MFLLLLTLLTAQADDARFVANLPGEAQADQCDREVCTSLLEFIDGADTSIDFAIYGLRGQTAILQALVRAQERGVRVRGIVDADVNGENYYDDTPQLMRALGTVHTDHETDLRTREALAGDRLPESYRCPRPRGFKGPVQCTELDLGDACFLSSQASREVITFQNDIMHNKFFVVDGRYLWTGSANVSDSGTGGYNANAVAVVESRKVARWYTQEFEQMYRRGRYHRDKKASGPRRARLSRDLAVDVWFSPQEQPMRYGVRPLIQGAEERIDVAVFFLTHAGVAQDLIDAHNRGVAVRVILDATAARNGYTKHEALREAGIPVKVEDWGGKMHMKAAVIDNEHVIVGSMNWTAAGENANDENTIIFESRSVARDFSAFYDELWESIDDRWLQGRPDPESPDSGTACTDGHDNDFDDLADAEDPGCGPNPPPLRRLPPHEVVPKGPGHGLVKAGLDQVGDRVFVAPGMSGYDWYRVDPEDEGQWFCSERAARAAGYRRMGR